MSWSDSVSFIRIASDLFTSEQNFIWILALQTTLGNFKHVKLGQILTGYKTGFVRPGHVYEWYRVRCHATKVGEQKRHQYTNL